MLLNAVKASHPSHSTRPAPAPKIVACEGNDSSDVSAVFLTLGEDTTELALARLGRQTVPLTEIIVVENVIPTYRAINMGVAHVRTEYFIQVDSDMLLDPTCIQTLRAAMLPEVGIAAALLRDPLVGRVPAIKLIRTECFDEGGFPDSVAPDIDFWHALRAKGWFTVYVLDPELRPLSHRFTLGEHCPRYTPLYTYRTYYLLGSKYRYRRDILGYGVRLEQLRRSVHPRATIARVALALGLFFQGREDLPKPTIGPENLVLLEDFLARDGKERVDRDEIKRLLVAAPRESFERFYELGFRFVGAGAATAFTDCLKHLGHAPGPQAWLAEASLCRGGLFADDPRRSRDDYALLRELVEAAGLAA